MRLHAITQLTKISDMARLFGLLGVSLLISQSASAHSGHHAGEGLLTEVFHWLWEPDHLAIIAVSCVAIGFVMKRTRRKQ